MSKRERGHTRQRWIEFTGLRFAKKFAAREEIVQAARGFFSQRNLAFQRLGIEFRRTRQPISWDYQSGTHSLCNGCFSERGSLSGRVIVYVEMRKYRGEFFQTLFHELDHMAWHLEGKPFDYDLPYWDRPHEVRARATGALWLGILEATCSPSLAENSQACLSRQASSQSLVLCLSK